MIVEGEIIEHAEFLADHFGDLPPELANECIIISNEVVSVGLSDKEINKVIDSYIQDIDKTQGLKLIKDIAFNANITTQEIVYDNGTSLRYLELLDMFHILIDKLSYIEVIKKLKL